MWLILPLRRRRSSNCVSLLSQRHIGLSCLVRLIGIDRSLHQISAFYHAICLVEQRLCCIVKTWVGLYWTWGGRGRRGGGCLVSGNEWAHCLWWGMWKDHVSALLSRRSPGRKGEAKHEILFSFFLVAECLFQLIANGRKAPFTHPLWLDSLFWVL